MGQGPLGQDQAPVDAGPEGVEPGRQVRIHRAEQAGVDAAADPALDEGGRARAVGLVPALAAPHHDGPLLGVPVGEPAEPVGVHGGAPDQQPARRGVQRVRVALAVTLRRFRRMRALPLDAVVPVRTEGCVEVEEIAELPHP